MVILLSTYIQHTTPQEDYKVWTYWPVNVRAHSSGGNSLLITSSVTSSGQDEMKLCMAEKHHHFTITDQLLILNLPRTYSYNEIIIK